MISNAVAPGLYFGNVEPKGAVDLRGLSTDAKPTEGVPNGSTFIEMDSGKVYMFDEKNAQWRLM